MIISIELKKLLSKEKSRISEFLLGLVDDKIGDTNDMISFEPNSDNLLYLSQRDYLKIQKTIKYTFNGCNALTSAPFIASQIKQKLGYGGDDENLVRNEIKKGLSYKSEFVSQSGKRWRYMSAGDVNIIALSSSFIQEAPDYKSKRIIGKFARVIQKVLVDKKFEFTQTELEDFTNTILSLRRDIYNSIIIEPHGKISEIYLAGNKSNGTIASSCMKNSAELLKFYDKQTNLSIITIRSEDDPNKVNARALLWKLTNGSYFVDRIYYSDSAECKLIKEFAKSKGYYIRNSSSGGLKEISLGDDKIDITSQKIKSIFVVDLDYAIDINKFNSDTDKLPYLDSFSNIDAENKIASPFKDNMKSKKYLVAQNQYGTVSIATV